MPFFSWPYSKSTPVKANRAKTNSRRSHPRRFSVVSDGGRPASTRPRYAIAAIAAITLVPPFNVEGCGIADLRVHLSFTEAVDLQ